MKRTLSTWEIQNALYKDEYAGWSYEGAKALAEYLEQYEEETGQEMELDVVAIRCDFSEYASAFEAATEHNNDLDFENAGEDREEMELLCLEYLRENTTVIEFDGGVIVAGF